MAPSTRRRRSARRSSWAAEARWARWSRPAVRRSSSRVSVGVMD